MNATVTAGDIEKQVFGVGISRIVFGAIMIGFSSIWLFNSPGLISSVVAIVGVWSVFSGVKLVKLGRKLIANAYRQIG